MGLINYNEIDFTKSKKENISIDFNGTEIIVVPYLSVQDKYDLIQSAIQKAFDGEIYQPILLNAYFNLYIIYMYTNIVFNDEDKADSLGLYDNIASSGLLDLVKNTIPEKEIINLGILLQDTLAETEKYNKSIMGIISNLINALPEKLSPMLETLEQLSPGLAEQVNAALATSSTEE